MRGLLCAWRTWPAPAPGGHGCAHWTYNAAMAKHTTTTTQDAARATPATPTPDQIKAARQQAGQTQAQAAAMLYCDGRAWRRWEAGERAMDSAYWELYQIKTIGLTPKK